MLSRLFTIFVETKTFMIIVNLIGNSITGTVKGERFGVAFTQEKYDAMKALEKEARDATAIEQLQSIVDRFLPLTQENFADTIETACPYIHVNRATGKFYLKNNNQLSTFPMPSSFVDRIIKSIEKGIDVMPLIKFWVRLLRNPMLTSAKAQRLCNYIAKTYVDQDFAQKLIEEKGVSRDVAVERATGLQTPITQEGLLCTYKVSKEVVIKYILDENGNRKAVDRYDVSKIIDPDTGKITETKAIPQHVEDRLFKPAVMGDGGDPFYCGTEMGHFIRVGQKHALADWNQVNTNDNVCCVPGLHVGNLDYIRGYQGSGTETHYTFVDPMYVGAVTDDGSGALRVKEYFTYDSFAGPIRAIYHSSTYANMTDAAWVTMREEAIERGNKLKAAIDQEINDLPQ